MLQSSSTREFELWKLALAVKWKRIVRGLFMLVALVSFLNLFWHPIYGLLWASICLYLVISADIDVDKARAEYYKLYLED